MFVDVGANHYKVASKTYYLESKLGWSGIAIEPQREFADEYKDVPAADEVPAVLRLRQSNHTARLYLRRRKDQVASSNEAFVKSLGGAAEVRDVPTMTLDDILDSEKIQRIDFLSMDIELHEPQALAGFHIERFKPSLVCVEGLLPGSAADSRLLRRPRLRRGRQVHVGRSGESLFRAASRPSRPGSLRIEFVGIVLSSRRCESQEITSSGDQTDSPSIVGQFPLRVSVTWEHRRSMFSRTPRSGLRDSELQD